jgi:hypothetical protein
MALPMRSMAEPIRPYDIAMRSGYAMRVPSFGATPFRQNGLAGLEGCGCDPVGGCGCVKGMAGMHGMNGFWDDFSSAVGNFFNSAGASASDPCNPNSPVFDAARCASATYAKSPILQWLPYVVGGLILYKLIK